MKRLFTLLLIALVLATTMPALADTDGYPDNILLENGIPYGNYGYPGLVKLHNGDMNKVVAHMRSARANQQGAGISYQRTVGAVSAAAAKGLLDQLRDALIREGMEGDLDLLDSILDWEGESAVIEILRDFLADANVSSVGELSAAQLDDFFYLFS